MGIHHPTLAWFAQSCLSQANVCMRFTIELHAKYLDCRWCFGNLFLSINQLQCNGKDPFVSLPILWFRVTDYNRNEATSQSSSLHRSFFRLSVRSKHGLYCTVAPTLCLMRKEITSMRTLHAPSRWD